MKLRSGPFPAVFDVTFDVAFPPTGVENYDAAIQLFAGLSGATDLEGQNAIAEYIRSLGRMVDWRAYPTIAGQNGTSTTLYGWGDWTTNNGTLQAGLTLGAGGAVMNGTSHYISVPDWIGTETITVFIRTNKVDDTANDEFYIGQYDTGLNHRSWALTQSGATITGDPVTLLRSADGTFAAGTSEGWGDAKTGIGSDVTYAAQWVDGGGRTLRVNKADQTLTLRQNTQQTARFNSAAAITVGCGLNSGTPIAFAAQTVKFFGIMRGTLTTAQQDAITDLINAL